MVLKKPKSTPELAWQIGSGMVPDPLRQVLDQKIITIHGADINGWSIAHLLLGGIFYLFGVGIVWANIVHALWEVFQAHFNITDLSLSSEWWDIVFDTAFFNLGYLLFALVFDP